MEGIKDSVLKVSENLQVLSEAFKKISLGIEEYAKYQDTAPKVQKATTRKAKSVNKKVTTPEKVTKPRKVKPKAKKKTAPVMKAKATTTKPVRVTATATVFGIIKDADDGANVGMLKEKTGFNDRKVANCIYQLKKQGIIKSAGRGIYTSM
jgi:hypothetical protein